MANKLESLFFFGRPFGPLYGVVMRIREQLYTKHVFTQHKVEVPVISVGNLVLGGTGKTPTVIFLAELLKGHGYRPAIVSRGYGGRAQGEVNVVSDGSTVLMNAIDSGDEPAMIASSLEDSPVLTGKKRIVPCIHAIQELGVNCIILDDGFQHMGVSRDINLVLFDADNLAGNSRIFPGGPLREPVAALKRTSAFLITGQTPANTERSNAFCDLLRSRFSDIPVFTSQYSRPQLWQGDRELDSIDNLDPAYIFCAIANPERVLKTAHELGIKVKGSSFLPDHKVYSQQLIMTLCKKAEESGARNLITTEKDFIKLKDYQFSLPLYVIKIRQEPEAGFRDFIIGELTKGKETDA